MNKNFGLSEDEFDHMVAQMKQSNNVLFEKIFFSNFKECIGFVQRKYQANFDDAYDATMDAMLEFRLRIIDGKVTYGNINFLFTKMASQKYYRNQKKYKSRDIEETDIPEADMIMDADELKYLSLSWAELGEACQRLFKLHFYGNMKLSDIARDDERTPLSVRKQKIRCLNKLMIAYSKHSKRKVNGEFSPII